MTVEYKKKETEVKHLSEYLIRTAIKYKMPIVVMLRSGREFVGVLKGINLVESRDMVLYKTEDLNKMDVSISYDDIEAVQFASAEKLDDTPVPF
jgi:hypothetical protein